MTILFEIFQALGTNLILDLSCGHGSEDISMCHTSFSSEISAERNHIKQSSFQLQNNNIPLFTNPTPLNFAFVKKVLDVAKKTYIPSIFKVQP